MDSAVNFESGSTFQRKMYFAVRAMRSPLDFRSSVVANVGPWMGSASPRSFGLVIQYQYTVVAHTRQATAEIFVGKKVRQIFVPSSKISLGQDETSFNLLSFRRPLFSALQQRMRTRIGKEKDMHGRRRRQQPSLRGSIGIVHVANC